MHEADPCVAHFLTALGVSHPGCNVALVQVLLLPGEGAVVLPRLLEVVLLLNALLHTGTRDRGLNPCVAMGLAGSLVIKLVLLSGLVVDLRSTWVSSMSSCIALDSSMNLA